MLDSNIPELRQSISFHSYDLLDLSTACLPESIFGDFDIVMCCNVLLYYKDDVQRFVFNKLLQATAPAGYLITGEAESMFMVIMKDGTVPVTQEG